MEFDEQVETVESSTTENTATERPSDPLISMSDDQRDHWLATGEIPASKKAESSDTAEKTDGDSTSKKAESSAAPASGKTDSADKKAADSATAEEQQSRKPSGAEARIKQLDSEVKQLRARLATSDPPKTDTGGEKKDSTKQPDPAPKMEDFEDPAEYIKAAIQHGVKAELKAAETERAELQKKTEQETQAKKVQKSLVDSFDAGRKAHDDFDEKALDPDLPVVMGSTFDHWLMDPDMTPALRSELLYHYGTHRDELLALNAMTPHAATRELNRVEAVLSKSDKKSEGETKKAESKPAAEKRVTNAPAPGSEVGAKGSPIEDPRAKAIASGDVATYMELENRKDASRKGGR